MTRLIEPVIADLQSEYGCAIRGGHTWRSLWIRLSGYAAFWKVIGLHATARAWPLTREWAAADDRALGRTLAFSCVASSIATMLLMYPPLSQTVRYAEDGRFYLRATVDQVGWLLFFVIPQAIPITVPIGVAIGIVCGLRGRAATLRTRRSIVTISVVCCAVMLVTLAWIVPAANQAFREIVAGRPQLPKGPNEMTLGELRTSGPRFLYHQRWALSFATLALGPFAFGLSASMRGRFRSIVIGVMASLAYYSLVYFFFRVSVANALTGWPPPFIAAWTPNIMFILVTLLLMRVRVHI